MEKLKPMVVGERLASLFELLRRDSIVVESISEIQSTGMIDGKEFIVSFKDK